MNIVAALSARQKFGLRGELWVLEKLKAMGHDAVLVSDFFSNCDLVVRADVNLPVEVKLARSRLQSLGRGRGQRLRWQWDCSRLPEGIDSVVVLIAVVAGAVGDTFFPFVVPSHQIVCRCRQPVVTSHPARYAGWLAPYLNRWQTVDDCLMLRRRYHHPAQMSFNLTKLSEVLV